MQWVWSTRNPPPRWTSGLLWRMWARRWRPAPGRQQPQVRGRRWQPAPTGVAGPWLPRVSEHQTEPALRASALRAPGPVRVPGHPLVPAPGPVRERGVLVPAQERVPVRTGTLEAQEQTCSAQAERATPYTVPAGNLWHAPERRPQRTR